MSLARDNTPESAAPSTPDSIRSVMAKLDEYHKVRGDFASNYITDRRDEDANVANSADQEEAAIAAAIASGRFPGRTAKKKAADVADGKSKKDEAASNRKGKQAKRSPINPSYTRTTRKAIRDGATIDENYNSSSDDGKLGATSYDFHTKELGPLKCDRPQSANHAAAADSGDIDADLAAMGIPAARIQELNGVNSAEKAIEGKAKPNKKKVSPFGHDGPAREAREELRADESVKRDMHNMLAASGYLEDNQERLAAAAQEIQAHYEREANAANGKRKAAAVKAVNTVDGSELKNRKTAKSTIKSLASANVEPRRSKRKAARAIEEGQAGVTQAAVKKRKITTEQTIPATNAPDEDADDYVYPVQGNNNRNSEWSIVPRLRARGKQRPTETLVSAADDSAVASDYGDSEFGDVHCRPNATQSKVAAGKRKRSEDGDEDDEDNEAEDAEAPKAKKARPNPAIGQEFEGQPSGHGYSARPPPEAELDVPWQCGDRMCTSGMTWLRQVDDNNKEVSSVGRKVISHYFGRNKSSTRSIPKDVWHWLCRKHYQREKYAKDHAKNETHPHQASALFYLENVEHQVVRLENWRPHATFKITIMTGAQRRLQDWYKHLAKHTGNTQVAAASFPVAPITNNKPKPELHFPILQLVHLSDNFCGDNKSYMDIRQMLLWVRGILNAGGSPAMAPFEILIDQPWTDDEGNEEPINDTTYSYQQWEAHSDGRPFDAAHAYQPGPGNPIPIFQPFEAPPPDHFKDVDTASDPEGAAVRNCAKMGFRVSDGKGGVMVAKAKTRSKSKTAGGAVQSAVQADKSNKRSTRPRRNAAKKSKK